MFKWFGGLIDSNEKELKRLQPIVKQINELDAEFERLSDAELRAKTDEFKARLKNGSSLDELLPEAFAAVRESAKRTIGQRHFDVQLMGGIALHQGKIAEMKTGEGKTLVATLPLYLNSLTGQGCHLVTVNDYLARRDPYWMGPIYHALGVSVASIYPMQNPDEHTPARLYEPGFDSGDKRWPYFRPISRREAYEADITYGTSSEFGFDYLRDNMTIDLSHCVQRELNYAIVDEVDNLLIDEARTPLIISAPDMEAGQKYQIFARLVPRLQRGKDYEVKEKERSVEPTDDGYATVERMLMREGILKSSNLYDPANADLHRHLRNALNAKELYKRDQQYMVKDGQVIIVDEFTGRLMLGRRYSEGLHQAIEAKEGVKVQQESKTYATITVQNYFRMYDKLAGMTGTALTEAEEFHKIYNLEVMVIPTNKPMIREDCQDQIYKDEEAKFRAVVREIEQFHKQERPVLIGTTSIEKSEYLSELLKRKGIPYEVLNAKYHEKEAYIIAQAGQPGATTVATNMAGRGVDIVLGGKEPTNGDEREWREWQEKHNKVIELGGLHIIGTERHEARRIDNQLRGRAGRQGDPGSSRFYVSLEDDIVRRFGGDRIKTFMEWTGMDEDTPIENALVNRTIADVQKRVEGYHFDMRKHLVEYDDVINQQRELIYGERKKVLSGADLKANILSMVQQEIQGMVVAHDGQDLEGLIADVSTIFPLPPAVNAGTLSQMKPEERKDKFIELAQALYEQREKELGSDNMRVLERLVMLRTMDNLWIEHLTMMENMRQEVGPYAMGRQRDPLVIYKNEGYKQFQVLLSTIRHDVSHTIYHVGIVAKEAPPPAPVAAQAGTGGKKQRLKVSGKKIGRNEPCPCGSGKKYKHCCGR
jgi:preprotein translocase subunit SecA